LVQGSIGRLLFALVVVEQFVIFFLIIVFLVDNVRSWQLSLGIARRFARHIRQFLWCFFVAAVWGIILPLFTNALFNM
jgi:hypothetical protein